MSFIKINNFKIFASSSYILNKNEDCTICRQHLNNDSIYAIDKAIKSTINTGLCGHMYHTECITPWF